jgi:prepilin-type N-terminal cleavage/methylation domain-containing protein
MNTTKNRRGFTLVELLVVIAIIGTITAIAVPTIFSAVASARNAKTKSELDLLHMALMNYKNEYGSFPPAYFGPVPNTNPVVALNNAATYTKHPVYRHLTRIFPRIKEDASYYANLAGISPAQALVFWLQGFYQNPEYPLTNGPTNPPGNRLKLFDFDESRLYAATAYVPGGAQSFAPRGSAAAAAMSPFPVFFTGHPNCGLPYVYFDARCYDNPPPGVDVTYMSQSTQGSASVASPYINSNPPANPTTAQQHMCSDTFQLIAAGRDDSYGTGQVAFPTDAPYTPPQWPTFTFQPVTNLTGATGHADNLTNFADRPLADAIEAMKPQ